MSERSLLKLARQATAPAISSLLAACAPQPLPRGEVIYVVVPPFEESGQLADQAARGNNSAVPDAPPSTPPVSDSSALSRGPLGGGIPPDELPPAASPAEAAVDSSLCSDGDQRTEEQTLYINTAPPVGVRARREPGQNAQSDGVAPQATPVTLECLRIFDGQEWFRIRYRIPDGEGGFWVLKDYLSQEPITPVRQPAPPVVLPPVQPPREPQVPEVVTLLVSGANAKKFPPGWAGDNFMAGNSRIRMEAPDKLGPRVIYLVTFVRAEKLPFDKWGIVVLVGGQEKKFFIKDPATAKDIDWQKKNGVVYGNDRPTRIRWRTWGTLDKYNYEEFSPELWGSGDVLSLELLEAADKSNKVLEFGPEAHDIAYYKLP